MDKVEVRIQLAFEKSWKLNNFKPNKYQKNNIILRLKQIFTEGELNEMVEKVFVSQVERVWPIAQYVDKE